MEKFFSNFRSQERKNFYEEFFSFYNEIISHIVYPHIHATICFLANIS